MAIRIENKQFWIEFIEIYHHSPELWKLRSDEYKNKRLKDQAYIKLIEKLKEMEPAADKEMVRKKINILRVSYRRELKKVVKSQRKSGNQDFHVPSLWYFENMDFLREISREISSGEESDGDDDKLEFPRIKKIKTDVESPQFEVEYTEPEIDNEQEQRNQEQNALDQNMLVEHRLQEISKPNHFMMHHQTDQIKISEKCSSCNKNDDGEADYLGKIWALQYKKLDATQQILAKKAIDDILFEARLGTLHRFSVSINQQ